MYSRIHEYIALKALINGTQEESVLNLINLYLSKLQNGISREDRIAIDKATFYLDHLTEKMLFTFIVYMNHRRGTMYEAGKLIKQEIDVVDLLILNSRLVSIGLPNLSLDFDNLIRIKSTYDSYMKS